jgi:predicted phosphohydrolase
MRIIVTADLHYHPLWIHALERMVRQVQDERPDCFILAGDVGHPLHNFERGLALFSGLTCPRLALAGNHDLWSGQYDSQSLWDHKLEDAAREAGFVWLDRESFRLGSLGICGTLGWYDYSAREPFLAVEDRDYFVNKGMFNNDGNHVDWSHTDQEFAAQVVSEFSSRLAALCKDVTISQVLVVTHVPPFKENLVHKPDSMTWSFNNAFAGNLTLGRAIVRCSKVSHVVSGHTHNGGHWQIAAPQGMIESCVVGSDYGQPAYVVLDFPWVVTF